MEPDQQPTPTRQTFFWLNGLTWVPLALCLLRLFQLRGTEAALDPMGLALPLAALGALANLLLALRHSFRGQRRLAWAYLLGCVFLAICLLGLAVLVVVTAPRTYYGLRVAAFTAWA